MSIVKQLMHHAQVYALFKIKLNQLVSIVLIVDDLSYRP